jgi:DNA-binding CsgD family transcriptional regulator
MWPIDRPRRWVEGEPGIGMSSLVVEALPGAAELGWDIGWGMADQLAERLPLSVIQDCLQVRLSLPDPRRAHAARLLRSQRLGLFADGDASVSSIEVLMTTIHPRGSQRRMGSMRELATRPAVPRVVRPLRVASPVLAGSVVSRCALSARLSAGERVVQISAPAGSGKTVLMRSWIAEAGLAPHAAWVKEDRDPRGFWVSVADALRGTVTGSALVRPLTLAPEPDGWAMVERLLTDLAPLDGRLWLVIDDGHLLDAREVLPQLELLLLRAPQEAQRLLQAWYRRVLRYLPTHLTAHEIASELFLSVNTVSTHTHHLYAKLGVHSRHGAVARARALGLLAPSPST